MKATSRRAELGQWFTPAPVAELALALALGDGLGAGEGRILDPACGDGAFLDAAVRAGVDPGRLVGIDVDPAAAAAAARRTAGAQVSCGDLFDLAEGEFAAVVGNPPYVRQELLSLSRKQAIRRRLEADYPDADGALLDRLIGRGDLAVAVVARAAALCRPGGRVAFVVSSALLDAGYARPLWRLIAPRAQPIAIVDAPAERWFAEAAVNAMILVLEARPDPVPVTVARLGCPTAKAARRVRRVADLGRVAELRAAPAGDPLRWVAALRASSVWFELEQAAAGALVPLSQVAEVRRGITSGANEVFYLTRAQAAAEGIERDLWFPLVRSPREIGGGSISIDPALTSHVAILCPAGGMRRPGAQRYFDARAAVATRPTLRARSPWWALPASPARLFLTKAYASRFVQRLAPRDVVADQRVYSIHPRPGISVDQLAAVLNATTTAFALESLGRSSLGEGALEWTVADALSLPVIDPRAVDPAQAQLALQRLSERPIASVDREASMPDRRALDVAVAPMLVPLLPAIHRALIESCARRVGRAGNLLRV